VPALADAFKDYLELDVALLSYLSVCARLLIVAPAILQQATVAVSPDDGGLLLRGLVRLMLDKFDAVGYSSSGMWRRKLWSIAVMAMYLYAPSEQLLEWLPEALVMCDDVAGEQQTESEEAHTGYDQDDEATADPLAVAFNRMIAVDGVTTVSIKRLVQERMEGLQLALGSAAFVQIMQRIDPASVKRLSGRLAMEATAEGRSSPTPSG
jgi:hypothetical protein